MSITITKKFLKPFHNFPESGLVETNKGYYFSPNFSKVFKLRKGEKSNWLMWISKKQANASLSILKNAFIVSPELIKSQNVVGFLNVLLVGKQGFGKTSIINTGIDWINREYYPQDRNIVFTNSLRYNLDNIEDVFYNYLPVDDAIEHQDAYSAKSEDARKASSDFFNIRHILENEFNRQVGYVVTIYGTQIYKRLDKNLRQADITFFCSTFNDKSENDNLRYEIGDNLFYWLEKKTKFVSLYKRYDANCFCVVKASSLVFPVIFPKPISNLKKMEINPYSQDDELDALRLLFAKNKIEREKVFKIMKYIYSTDRNTKPVPKREQRYIWELAKGGLNSHRLAQVFKRSSATTSKYVNEMAERVKTEHCIKE